MHQYEHMEPRQANLKIKKKPKNRKTNKKIIWNIEYRNKMLLIKDNPIIVGKCHTKLNIRKF